jgi:hypothetical protein
MVGGWRGCSGLLAWHHQPLSAMAALLTSGGEAFGKSACITALWVPFWRLGSHFGTQSDAS